MTGMTYNPCLVHVSCPVWCTAWLLTASSVLRERFMIFLMPHPLVDFVFHIS
jgi:hypothetical protein